MEIPFSNSEDSETNDRRPSYLDPWIVSLLLEFKESETRKDGQIGHVLKVLNHPSALNHDGAAVLCLGDGRNSIETICTAQPAQMSTCSGPQSKFSGLVGQFIVLQSYRVCFKEASEMEDCEFYIVLDCFHIMPLHRQATKHRNCNREPSVLQKIKELWQKRCAPQFWLSSEPSVSEVLEEIKDDRLSILKQNVRDCLSNPSNEVDCEQLNIYPETKWQAACKQDKACQDIFVVPAKLLASSAESEETFYTSCSPKISQIPDAGESSQNEDCSTISFLSAEESHDLDSSLENPWNALPGLTLASSSDSPGTPPGLPLAQQMLLASTAEKEASCSNGSTPDFLEPCACVSHFNSEQTDSVVTASPALLPSHHGTSVKESVRAPQMHATHHNMSVTVDSIPCGQPLHNSHFPTPTLSKFSAHPSSGNDFSLEATCVNTEKSRAASSQRSQVRKTGDEAQETARKGVAVKRKQMMASDDEASEACLIPACTRQKTSKQPSATDFPHSQLLGKLPAWKPPLTFVSTPKRSRIEESHVHQVSARLRHSERLLRKRVVQGAADGTTRHLEQPPGIPQQCVRGPSFKKASKSPELCAQVRSARISRGLLEWAGWVINNMQD